MKALIIDDEELARAVVREHLAAHPDVEVVAECANGFEAIKAAAQFQPDLIFLDIQMPKLDGFEVLELLEAEGKRPAVVFVTAYDQHALRAFEAHAVDYLLKPFSKDRFDGALAKARALQSAQPASASTPAITATELATSARQGKPLERIVVKDGPKVTVVHLDRLDWVQAQDDYVLLRTEGKNLLKQQTLASLEAQLDPNRFIRIHRSYILNLDRLVRVEQDTKEHRDAILRDGARLPVSRAGYQRLRELWEGA
ncbi:LytTR family DNA-binding domain-containing protein [Geothrix sp. PMB-07]|uniref:LytR/AlgR family response regulator transcription factor n=1 Tax=Geothrix sp. PMB-07 TaxID=3068640 RepID=UPI002742920F|nr:response regulator [Geothrix sp. PMB-07]WLT30162.1 response regulator [Geothrix sp. PMB-07]